MNCIYIVSADALFWQREGAAEKPAVATEWQHFSQNEWFPGDPRWPRSTEITRQLPIIGTVPPSPLALQRRFCFVLHYGREVGSGSWSSAIHLGLRLD